MLSIWQIKLEDTVNTVLFTKAHLNINLLVFCILIKGKSQMNSRYFKEYFR